MTKITKKQRSILAALARRPSWPASDVIDTYDGRSLWPLKTKGMIELQGDGDETPQTIRVTPEGHALLGEDTRKAAQKVVDKYFHL